MSAKHEFRYPLRGESSKNVPELYNLYMTYGTKSVDGLIPFNTFCPITLIYRLNIEKRGMSH